MTCDLLLIVFIWYGSVRLVLDTLKANTWLLFGVPTAQIIAAVTVMTAVVALAARHRDPGPREELLAHQSPD